MGMRNNNVINTKHATVHTASINVGIMRLDNKQVTLSVFRQIPEKSIFGNYVRDTESVGLTVSLLGTPWGIVRYTWGDSPKWVSYYLVWQLSGRLFRMGLPALDDLERYGIDFFKSIGDAKIWYSQEDGGDIKSIHRSYINHLATFEELDQLFISV